MAEATVLAVNGSVVRASQRAMWLLRPWPNDPSVAHLVFTDHLAVPTADDLRLAVDQARRRGRPTVRTSALFPRAAAVAEAAGFDEADRLALLKLTLDDTTSHTLTAAIAADPVHRTRSLRSWQHLRAATVDQDAFGRTWGNDAGGILDIRNATPVNRARWVRSADDTAGDMAGFVIAGAAGDSGYVQRLSVATAHQRRGIGQALVVDVLAWMRRRRLTSAYVNTGVTNDAALALYEGLGFTRLDEQLVIAEFRGDR